MSSKVKRILLVLAGVSLLGIATFGQSRVVENYRKDNKADMKLFFYKSTLRMYAQLQKQLQDQFLDEDMPEIPQLTEMIAGIEKVKFFKYNMDDYNKEVSSFQELSSGIMDEGYEEMASASMQGNQITIYMMGEGANPEGFVILTLMDDAFTIIDIEGSPNFNQLFNFSTYLNNSSSQLSLSGILN